MSDIITTPEERRAEVERLAAQLDVTDPAAVLRFGQEAQTRASAAADAMLEGAKNREAGEAGQTLGTLLTTLRGFDVSGLADKPGFFARMFNKAGAEAAQVLSRYEGLKDQGEAIGDKLDGHRTRLLEDVEKLERLYGATLDWFHGLGDHIAAGEIVLNNTDSAAIPEAETKATAGDMLAAQKLRDLRAARDELDRRIHDLRLTRQVAMQALPSIRLIQENDKALAAKSGNKLTQTLNEQGELVGVSQTQGSDFAVDPEPADGAELNAADIRNQLFNAENVVLHPERSDHGLSALAATAAAAAAATAAEAAAAVDTADFEEVD